MAKAPKPVELVGTDSWIMYSNHFGPAFPPLKTGELEEEGFLDLGLLVGFDHEKLPGNKQLLHIDLGFDVNPIGEIGMRYVFQMVDKRPMKDLIQEEMACQIIEMCYEEAIASAMEFFNEKGDDWKIEWPEKKSFSEMFSKMLLDELSRIYIVDEKGNDLSHDLVVTSGLSQETQLIFKGTFAIMDAVFFKNTKFNLRHNRALLDQVLPVQYYQSVKLACGREVNGKVSLTRTRVMQLLVCVDCAAQIMLSEKAPHLKDVFAKVGFPPGSEDLFIPAANRFVSEMKKSVQDPDVGLPLFDKRPDWFSQIR